VSKSESDADAQVHEQTRCLKCGEPSTVVLCKKCRDAHEARKSQTTLKPCPICQELGAELQKADAEILRLRAELAAATRPSPSAADRSSAPA
jgi:hypothetical protein